MRPRRRSGRWGRALLGSAAAVAVGCAGAPAPRRVRAAAAAAAVDWSGVVAPGALRGMRSSAWVPVVVGPFQRVYRPPGTRYLNDHTLVREAGGRWHLFGITHESDGDPSRELSLLHATAPALFGPWSDAGDALHSQPPEEALWAPFVLPVGARRWAMFYYGNTPDHRVLRAESADLHRWERSPASAPGGRDPFVLRVGGAWYLYSVGADERREVGQILVSESRDLVRWSDARVALTDPVASFGWGNLESPMVVRRGGEFYLFVTRTSPSPHDYARTVVFASADPTRFAWEPVTELMAHAAEVIEDGGEWFITSAGWTAQMGERWRGLSVAPLAWAPRASLR